MMKNDPADTPLRLSLLFAAIALVAIVVLVLGQRWYAALEVEAEDMTERGSIIGTNASAALLFNDAEAAVEILAALKSSTYVVEAALYRADGSRLAAYRRHGKPTLPDSLPPGAPGESRMRTLKSMQISLPVRLGERDVGTVVLKSSMGRVYRVVGEFLGFFLMILTVALALASFASFRLRRRIRESRRELLDSEYMIRQLSLHRDQLVEQEHKRIAIEIHDDLGQILTTAMLHLRRLHRQLRDGGSETAKQVEEVEGLLGDAFRSIKNIAMDLRPSVLDFGVASGLEWLGERILGGSGVAFHLNVPDPPLALAETVSTTLFRIAQESLTNVVRHARARNVWVALKVDEDHLTLSIEDDGAGFAQGTAAHGWHFGLLGIRERAAALSGHVEISTSPGKGTYILVTVPRAVALEEEQPS